MCGSSAWFAFSVYLRAAFFTKVSLTPVCNICRQLQYLQSRPQSWWHERENMKAAAPTHLQHESTEKTHEELDARCKIILNFDLCQAVAVVLRLTVAHVQMA